MLTRWPLRYIGEPTKLLYFLTMPEKKIELQIYAHMAQSKVTLEKIMSDLMRIPFGAVQGYSKLQLIYMWEWGGWLL